MEGSKYGSILKVMIFRGRARKVDLECLIEEFNAIEIKLIRLSYMVFCEYPYLAF